MTNSRGYISYQTVENAYCCVPYINISMGMENKVKETP